jgi:hypothetical protein
MGAPRIGPFVVAGMREWPANSKLYGRVAGVAIAHGQCVLVERASSVERQMVCAWDMTCKYIPGYRHLANAAQLCELTHGACRVSRALTHDRMPATPPARRPGGQTQPSYMATGRRDAQITTRPSASRVPGAKTWPTEAENDSPFRAHCVGLSPFTPVSANLEAWPCTRAEQSRQAWQVH